MASANKQSANEPARTSYSSTQYSQNKTIKAQISGRMASVGVSDVVAASVYSEKTRLKKCMMIMIIVTENHLLVNEKRRCRDG